MQAIDLIEAYAYGAGRDLVCKKEEIKCNNIIKQCEMFNIDLKYKRRHKRTWKKKKNVRLNSTHLFVLKIVNKGELHQIAFYRLTFKSL